MYGTKAAHVNKSPELANTDTGPRERHQHHGGVILATRTITEGGMSTSVGAQARLECALDALLGSDPGRGSLSGSEGTQRDREAVARSRYEAGMKLRRLFVKAGLVAIKAFDPDGRGGGAEISDTQALARRGYNDLIRRLGQWGEIAAGVACFDCCPDNERWRSNVRRALDKLCEVVL